MKWSNWNRHLAKSDNITEDELENDQETRRKYAEKFKAEASLNCIGLTLLKVGAVVIRSTCRIRILMKHACPRHRWLGARTPW